eukprot:TRINITY_DN15235_c0_g1_i1.p1 TRINITY_DN15235_c0_g1~~TRINITY_DN15235_c0_g1_i1.p1  ORF type:complete len:117 (-),score=11.19 TRINITY_DN15235_c0_g1_i1:138-464(-)
MEKNDTFVLHQIVCKDNLEQLKHALKHKTNYDLNQRDKHGNTMLILAIYLKKTDIVKYLLDKGADPLVTSKIGWTSMHTVVPKYERLTLKTLSSLLLLGIGFWKQRKY